MTSSLFPPEEEDRLRVLPHQECISEKENPFNSPELVDEATKGRKLRTFPGMQQWRGDGTRCGLLLGMLFQQVQSAELLQRHPTDLDLFTGLAVH